MPVFSDTFTYWAAFYLLAKYNLAPDSELKENYCYWTKFFSDIISLLGSKLSPIREIDTIRIKKYVALFCNMIELSVARDQSITSGDFCRLLITFVNSLDPAQAPRL